MVRKRCSSLLQHKSPFTYSTVCKKNVRFSVSETANTHTHAHAHTHTHTHTQSRTCKACLHIIDFVKNRSHKSRSFTVSSRLEERKVLEIVYRMFLSSGSPSYRTGSCQIRQQVYFLKGSVQLQKDVLKPRLASWSMFLTILG